MQKTQATTWLNQANCRRVSDHVPGMSRFFLPPRLHPLDSSSLIISQTEARNSAGRGTKEIPARAHLTREAQGLKGRWRLHWQSLTTDFEGRLALRRYTARNHRHPAQSWYAFACRNHRDGERDTRAGWRATLR